jgi:hypothetical protein
MKLPLGVTNKGVRRYDVFDSNGETVSIQPDSTAAWAFVKGYYQALVDTGGLPEELEGIENRSYLDTTYPRPPEAIRQQYQKL